MSTSKYNKRFDGMSRDELEAVASIALEASEALAEANRRLDSCVQRCARILAAKAGRCNRPGIHLLGWHCSECGAFNGAEKELLRRCRACETAIPPKIEEELRSLPQSAKQIPSSEDPDHASRRSKVDPRS